MKQQNKGPVFIGLILSSLLTWGCSTPEDKAGTDSGLDSDTRSLSDVGVKKDAKKQGEEDSGKEKDQGNKSSSTGLYFPKASWISQSIVGAKKHEKSDLITKWLADEGGWGLGHMQIDFGIEVLEATADTPKKNFLKSDAFYEPDCDDLKMPLPEKGVLEGESGYACESDGDCHLIVVARHEQRIYEMWRADIRGDTFNGGCLAVWDTSRVYGPEGRGEQCTSADAAGFPILPLLFNADEIAAGEINHAIRFILPNARMRKGFYVHPATHAGGPKGPEGAPLYGSRWRLKSDFDLNSLPNEGAKVVARAMQKYGMVLADGGQVALTAQSDRATTAKWKDHLGARDLDPIQPTDFEIIDTGKDIKLTYDCVRSTF